MIRKLIKLLRRPRRNLRYSSVPKRKAEHESSEGSVEWCQRSQTTLSPSIEELQLLPSDRIHINNLPLDVLELIFMTSVFWESCLVSPVVLSEVCKLWRTLALSSARLWTRLDLFSFHEAKQYFRLSQEAPLYVYWRSSTRNIPVLPVFMYEWAWQHTHRFAELTLYGNLKVRDVQHVLQRLKQADLRSLSKLSVCAPRCMKWESTALSLCLNMPSLRSLHFRYAFILFSAGYG